MQIVDAHCHFWHLARGDYDWLAEEGGALAPIRRDFGPDDHPGAGAEVIAVQAAATVAETDHLLSLAQRTPWIRGVVGWVDLGDPAAAAAIGTRAQNPVFRGIRPMLQDIADTDWLVTGPRADALAAIAAHGLVFDALVSERHLPVLARFVQDNPDIAVVIDHAAKPRPGLPQGWRDGMRALADLPGVHCKLSGLMTELPGEDDILRCGAFLFDLFGAERLIWGSDWPVMTLGGTYARWRDLTEKMLAGADRAARLAVLGGNARRFYGVAA